MAATLGNNFGCRGPTKGEKRNVLSAQRETCPHPFGGAKFSTKNGAAMFLIVTDTTAEPELSSHLLVTPLRDELSSKGSRNPRE